MREWWRGAVIYQIYPCSFADGNGDGIGDLPGVTQRLDYVASLGVDGIWLSPFFVSPMRDFGYDVADYRDVDPIFGTLADFDRLIERAHGLGLKVIIDQVYSHTSDQHPWFQESRADRHNGKADWYVWADPKPDGTPPNNWLSVFGGPAWTWDSRRRQYWFHNFLQEQPDLDFHHPAVQEAVLAVARFWLDRGVDGFRIDVANLFCHDPGLRDNPPAGGPRPERAYKMQRPLYTRNRPETLAFVARLRALLDGYPGTMAVAEIAAEDRLGTMIAYTDGADRYHTAYSFVFLGDAFSAGFIRQTIEEMQARSATAWPAWAFSNHDSVRVVSRWGGEAAGPPFAKLLLALLTTLPGTVFIYQGEELGLPQADIPYERLRDPEAKAFWPHHRGRDGARTPMPWRADMPNAGFSVAEPWLPVDPRHMALSVERQEGDAASVLSFCRRLLAWRRQHPALIEGGIRFLASDGPLLAFERCHEGERILCAFNFGDARRRLETPHSAEGYADSGLSFGAHIDDEGVQLAGWGLLLAPLKKTEPGGPQTS
ncbi:MAG: alpha-glucosidase [Rhodospirillales bacterium]